MSVVFALVRLALAAVFVVSAVAKIRDRAGSRQAVEAFAVPSPLVGLVAAGLPVTELLCALLLVLPDPLATTGAVASLVLLAGFTVAVVAQLVRGNHPACHCFGSMGESEGIGWGTVARNAGLILLAVLPLAGAGSLSWVGAPLLALEPVAALLLLVGVLAAAALVVMGLTIRTLVQRYGAVLVRLDTLEQTTGLVPPPPAPDFTLPDLHGEEVALTDSLGDGRSALLVFISPGCSMCDELLPDLLQWQQDPAHPVRVLVLSEGSVQANQAKVADVGDVEVLVAERELSAAYAVQGTPAAVVVTPDALLGSVPVHGVGAVRDLHAALEQQAGHPQGHDHGHDHEPTLHTIEPRPIGEGDPVPATSFLLEGGREAGHDEVLGEEAVVLFWRVDCGFCQQILDDVVTLESSAPVRLVSGSPVEQIRGQGLTSPVLIEPGGTLERWLGVPGTPSAAWVRGGELAAPLAVGGPDVLSLLASARPADALVD